MLSRSKNNNGPLVAKAIVGAVRLLDALCCCEVPFQALRRQCAALETRRTVALHKLASLWHLERAAPVQLIGTDWCEKCDAAGSGGTSTFE